MTAHKTTTHHGVRWGKAYSSTWCDTCGWRKTGSGVFGAAADHRQAQQDLNNATIPVVSLPQRTETPIWGNHTFTKK